MKKKIPLSILQAVQPHIQSSIDLIKPINDENTIFHLRDIDENSKFYFKVIRQEFSNGKLGYITELKPKDSENMDVFKTWLQHDELVIFLGRWLKLLDSYSKIYTIFDDPILKIYQENFEKQFDIIDENASYAPFDLSQQLYLDEYLKSVKNKIEILKEGKSESEIEILNEISQEASLIQKDLSKDSKKKIIKRLSKILAKAQKVGLDVIKEIFVSVSSELAKRLITGE